MSGWIRLKLYIAKYKYDVMATIAAIVVVIISARYSYREGTLSTFLPAILSSLVLLAALAIILLMRQRNRRYIYTSLKKSKHRYQWIGSKEFQYDRDNDCFCITNTDVGAIHSGCLTWSNYDFSFDFRILNTCVAFIVRADNLANYVMMQIQKNQVRPHLRINGGWVMPEDNNWNIEFEEGKELSFERWYHCHVTCDQENVHIRILDKQEPSNAVFDRIWPIPEGPVSTKFDQPKEEQHPVWIPFAVTFDYGSVGFRNWGTEKALIKDVVVKRKDPDLNP